MNIKICHLCKLEIDIDKESFRKTHNYNGRQGEDGYIYSHGDWNKGGKCHKQREINE